ncbi:photosystem II core complex proteins psbY, chloroplastic [Oryza glaberrima]|uniref:Photosystem II core complex proteins psbY, chloroplastic n=2 Tax=Oryza TaxID=4527 RepID=A0A0E0I6Q3_ORYNI|nr:photosystem II core complex proteins psbY, chloroplastic [Oryza glaberrima]
MATTIAAMAMLKPSKIVARSSPAPSGSGRVPSISLKSLAKKGMSVSSSSAAAPVAAAAMAGAFFSALASTDAALAAQQIADVAAAAAGADDNRGLALLLPIAPAIAWVLYNILQPALNQLNRMRSEQVLVAGLGLGAAAGAGLAFPPEASAAQEVARLAAEAAAAEGGDNRGLLLLFVVAPAIAWVLYNILQPALNQLNRMRSD